MDCPRPGPRAPGPPARRPAGAVAVGGARPVPHWHNCTSQYENPHPKTVFPEPANWVCCPGEHFRMITFSVSLHWPCSCASACSADPYPPSRPRIVAL